MKTLALVILLSSATAEAWEAETTHAGLTEQAALGSGVHAVLVKGHGRDQGWFEPLTVLPTQAANLYKKIGRLAPSGGFVPDARGRQTALAWLVAGAVLEDIPGARGKNHFYDPVHKTGLSGRGGVGARVLAAIARQTSGGSGRPAHDWVAAKDNDLGMERFLLELEASALARTRAERDTHLAFALLCAGAMTHVLEDVGSPSRARNDFSAHLAELGAGSEDRGSRLERLAALAFGRLGVSSIAPPVQRKTWREYFTAADGKGLADLTASRWYSAGTLPDELNVAGLTPTMAADAAARSQRFPAPRPGSLQLEAARGPEGARLAAEDGTCLAHYRRAGEIVSWFIPDPCATEQVAAILPEVGGYASGFLAWLFRGQLVLDPATGVAAGEVALGKGTLRVLGENAAGERGAIGTPIAIEKAEPGVPVATLTIPAGMTRVVAVFRGVDANGEEIVAIGSFKP